jgi:NAD-dependent SIR2 family protein deacetylase
MIESLDAQRLRAAQRIVHTAQRLVVISGAGMSADSGIATFRGAGSGGGWDEAVQRLATPEAFRADPQRVWDFYLQRRHVARQAQPFPAATVTLAGSAGIVLPRLLDIVE